MGLQLIWLMTALHLLTNVISSPDPSLSKETSFLGLCQNIRKGEILFPLEMLEEWTLNLELPDTFLKPPRERLPENKANMEKSRATGWALQD